MICYHDKISKQNVGGGILMQHLGPGSRMNVLHWDMEDKSQVELHKHSHEQFGYVIQGGFKFFLGNETFFLKEGDSYFVPPNVEHGFIAIGKTEAIDVFTPVKEDIPKSV